MSSTSLTRPAPGAPKVSIPAGCAGLTYFGQRGYFVPEEMCVPPQPQMPQAIAQCAARVSVEAWPADVSNPGLAAEEQCFTGSVKEAVGERGYGLLDCPKVLEKWDFSQGEAECEAGEGGAAKLVEEMYE